jgi:predicted  nucleic acid-binding Zn-ribbon protein
MFSNTTTAEDQQLAMMQSAALISFEDVLDIVERLDDALTHAEDRVEELEAQLRDADKALDEQETLIETLRDDLWKAREGKDG